MSEHGGLSSQDLRGLPMESYLEGMENFFSPMAPIDTELTSSLPAEPFPLKAVLVDIYGTLLISEAGDIGLTAMDVEETTPAVLFQGSQTTEYPYGEIRDILHDQIKRNHSLSRQNDPTIQYPEVDILSIWEQAYQRMDIKKFRIDDLVRTALHFELQTNRIWLMPAAEALLRGLASLGIPTGIVSNAQFYTPVFLEYLLKRSLASLGIDEETSTWSYKIGRGKPDLRIFRPSLEVMKRKYGISPHEILYIGNDMLNDIYTAAASGLKTALFAGDKRSLRLREGHPDTAGIQPDCVITGLLQILPYIRDAIR